MQKARKFRRFGRIFFPLWLAFVAVFICLATADSVWRLGWGYRPQDILIGAGMLVFGAVFWLIWDRLLWVAERYGPSD